MRQVAFLRNVNQGQWGHPSTRDILNAFHDAGCADAACFQSNGTVVFTAGTSPGIIADVLASIAARSGAEREGFVIPLEYLARVVRLHAAAVDASRREFTLHSGGTIDGTAEEVVQMAARHRCVIVDAGAGWVVTANQRDRESNATPIVEKITGGSATSRGVPTLLRLFNRFPPTV